MMVLNMSVSLNTYGQTVTGNEKRLLNVYKFNLILNLHL